MFTNIIVANFKRKISYSLVSLPSPPPHTHITEWENIVSHQR